jgi:hypothetical protein
MIGRCAGFSCIVFLVLFGLGIAVPSPAQDENLVERTICVLDPVDLSEEDFGNSETIKLLIADTVAVLLADKGYNVIDVRTVREEAGAAGLTGEALLEKQKIIDFAKSLGADVVINGVFRIEGQQILIGVKAYDIFTGRIATSAAKKGEAGFAIYDTVDEAAELMAGKVRENLKPLPESVITVEREKVKIETKIVEEVVSVAEEVEITFTSKDDGAEIYLGGEKLIATIEGGTAEFAAKAETVLDLVIKKEDYHDRTMSIKLGNEKQRDITIPPLYPVVKYDLSALITSRKLLGATGLLRYHFIPDFLLVRARMGVYYLPHAYELWEEGVDWSTGMLNTTFGVSIGWYPFISPNSVFRLCIYIGPTADIYIIPGSTAPFHATIGSEWGFRYDLNFPRFSLYLFTGGQWFWAEGNEDGNPPYFEFGGGITFKL